MKILWIKQIRNGETIFEQNNIFNMLHEEGEQFLLNAVFTGGQVNTYIPENYYIGLDNRPSVLVAQDIDSLVDEPTTNGYLRQPVSSSGDFVVTLENSHYQATSPIVAFQAVGGDWGPVGSIFLSNRADNLGVLLCSAMLESQATVTAGDSILMRIALKLKDCEAC